MKLVILVLNKAELLEDVIEYFVEVDIRGATILDSVGMGKILAYDIPIFAGFRDIMAGSRSNNKTILTTVPADRIDEIMDGMDRIVHFDQPGTGVAMVLDVAKTYGIG